MNARETADRHGGDVAGGNMQGAMADFTPEGMQAFMAKGVFPPRGANKFEIVGEGCDDTNPTYDIKYSKDDQSLTIRSKWGKVGDDWKILSADPLT
jgi:hypothetical protein